MLSIFTIMIRWNNLFASLQHRKFPELKFYAGKVYRDGKGARPACLNGHPECGDEGALPGGDHKHNGGTLSSMEVSSTKFGAGE